MNKASTPQATAALVKFGMNSFVLQRYYPMMLAFELNVLRRSTPDIQFVALSENNVR